MSDEAAALPAPDDASRVRTARSILDEAHYVVLATAGADGAPWASPVYFATSDYTEFFWVSDPTALHSRNIEQRAEVGMVVFDSTVAPGTGQGVYMTGVAERVADAEVEAGLAVYSAGTLAAGLTAWTLADVQDPQRLRLYRARAEQQWVLEPDHDRRVPVVFGSR